MNTENISEEELLADILTKMDNKKTNSTSKSTRYQYSYVDLEQVMVNPSEYIIPQCLPACRALWSKNIETFMVSNNDDNDLYVLLTNLSPENIAIFEELQKQDPRFIYNSYRNTIGITVKGNDESAIHELESLTDKFKNQDSLRFKKTEDFLEEYKHTDGEMVIENDGTTCRKKNPNLENATLKEALEKTGKSHLYIPEEGRIYESTLFLKWHKRYQQSLLNDLQEQISYITPKKDNIDGNVAYLRDIFLSAEREYVAELLKDASMKRIIEDINQQSTDALFTLAERLVNQIDLCQIPDEQMDHVEKQLIVLFTSIQDRVLTKELVLTPNVSNGRSK